MSGELKWAKSSLSFSNSNCVEVARNPDGSGVLMRNSKQPAGPWLRYTWAEWRAFVGGVAAGDFGALLK